MVRLYRHSFLVLAQLFFQHHVDRGNYRDDSYETPQMLRCIKICIEFLGNIDKRSFLLVEKEAARGNQRVNLTLAWGPLGAVGLAGSDTVPAGIGIRRTKTKFFEVTHPKKAISFMAMVVMNQ